ncbi:hypothetical protein [Endozoicomonas sp. 4G]|uniref:hypothetical protein n=1 Tax=Endozoicomonas sp. 4G TaxID=2872754 RepID=UPI002078E8D2|nr:hypothetical protein [Endozoicomonas sp. 4G]
MNGIDNNSKIVGSPTPHQSQSQSQSETAMGVSMGRDVKSQPSLLNFTPVAGTAQLTVPGEESKPVKDTLEEVSCAFSRTVSAQDEIKVGSGFLSNATDETLGTDKQCMSDKSPIKANSTCLSPLELSANELKNQYVCHITAEVLAKNLAKGNCSIPYVFSSDKQDIYKAYINCDPENDYIFVHKISYIHENIKTHCHDFVILRENNNFHILQSMVGLFTLNQWLTGDSSTIDDYTKTFKEGNDLILLNNKSQLKLLFSNKEIDEVKRIWKELKSTKHLFNKIIKTRKNKPCSKAIFNQKILPTLFEALRNSDDRSYFRMFSASRRHLKIKPEYEIFLEVQNAKI